MGLSQDKQDEKTTYLQTRSSTRAQSLKYTNSSHNSLSEIPNSSIKKWAEYSHYGEQYGGSLKK